MQFTGLKSTYYTQDINTFLSGSFLEKPFVVMLLDIATRIFETDE